LELLGLIFTSFTYITPRYAEITEDIEYIDIDNITLSQYEFYYREFSFYKPHEIIYEIDQLSSPAILKIGFLDYRNINIYSNGSYTAAGYEELHTLSRQTYWKDEFSLEEGAWVLFIVNEYNSSASFSLEASVLNQLEIKWVQFFNYLTIWTENLLTPIITAGAAIGLVFAIIKGLDIFYLDEDELMEKKKEKERKKRR